MMRYQLLYLVAFISSQSSLAAIAAPKMCGPGAYLSSDNRRRRSLSLKCVSCTAGRYMTNQKHQYGQCWQCPSGKWVGTEGANQCQSGPVCSPGRYGKTGATSHNQVIPCQDCVKGRYQPVFGQGECLSCPGGQSANTTASHQCKGTPCTAGYYGVTDATVTGLCHTCPVNTFIEYHGSLSCSACPSGKYNTKPRMTYCTDLPNCGPYHYVTETYTCSLCHPYIEYVGITAWVIFAISTFSVLFPPQVNLDFQMVISIIMTFIIGLTSVNCKGKGITDISLYFMMGGCVGCLLQNVYVIFIKTKKQVTIT